MGVCYSVIEKFYNMYIQNEASAMVAAELRLHEVSGTGLMDSGRSSWRAGVCEERQGGQGLLLSSQRSQICPMHWRLLFDQRAQWLLRPTQNSFSPILFM